MDGLTGTEKHFNLLSLDTGTLDENEIRNTPVFTESVRQHMDDGTNGSKPTFPQYGLLGGDVSKLQAINSEKGDELPADIDNPFIYQNVKVPSSVFICGSQGSGKSHTLSCLLENCLLPSDANTLPKPLTGIVFHYDPFVSNEMGGQPCEAAYLSSNKDVEVRVLCPPTNIRQIKLLYEGLPNVKVQELRLSQSDLNTQRMLDLMAISSVQGGSLPLYFHVVIRILRELRLQQQQNGGSFDYQAFKRALNAEELAPGQKNPLEQRLDTLESFMAKEHVMVRHTAWSNSREPFEDTATTWKPKAGQLTIIDLSCPCVTAGSACTMFNICLNLFLEQDSDIGKIVALDEAHKYMTDSDESQTLTESLLSTIRQQRHLGTRVAIATQEPTISPKLLDLCSVTIVHRFTSPDWLASLKKHLAAASPGLILPPNGTESAGQQRADALVELFRRIVSLRQGEALLFCPSAIVGVTGQESPAKAEKSGNGVVHLGQGCMHVRIRKRVTEDGGKSVMAG